MSCFGDAPVWICKFGPELLNGDPIRGYWILHFPPETLWKNWSKLAKMTESGQLGYRVSKCSEPMTYGPYEDWTSICCFALLSECQEVRGALYEAGFRGKYKFRLLKKFREKDEVFEDEDYYGF